MSGTVRKALVITGGLIAGYLVLVHFKGFKSDTLASGTAGKNVVKTLQGR